MDPNIVPQIVGSLLEGPQNNAPPIFGSSHMLSWARLGLRVLRSEFRPRSSGISSFEDNIGAFIIRIGFWVMLYYNYNKEPPE